MISLLRHFKLVGVYILCIPFFLIISNLPCLDKQRWISTIALFSRLLILCVVVGWDVEALAIEKDLILNCSQVLLLDHHVGGGPSWAGLHHAGGPGVEHLLALAHHTLARAELSMARRVLSAAWSPAFSRAPVDHPTKLLARTLRGTLWWVASCLVTSLSTRRVSPVVANVAVVARRLLLQLQLWRMVSRMAAAGAQLLRVVLVELKKFSIKMWNLKLKLLN